MNTAVKIKSCTRAAASGKVAYNEERTKNKGNDILLLEKNEMPPLQTLSLDEKKEIQAIQKKISQSEKRLAKAIEDGKEKSIKTNQKNLDAAKKELENFGDRQDKREKYFTEFTIALTNSQGESYANDWSQKALEHIKQEYPMLDVVSAVEHRDQHSPHMHILLHSKEKPITQVLAERTGQKDTSRESMKEAYSKIAHNFHSFANENIAHNELKTLQKGLKYVSLGQYKQKGNFEAQIALESKKEQNLDYLLQEKEKLEAKAQQISRYQENKWRDMIKFSVVTKERNRLLGLSTEKYSFITIKDIEQTQRENKVFLESMRKNFNLETKDEAKEMNKYFDVLLKEQKRTKDREYSHWDKEQVIEITPKLLDKFLEDINKNIAKVYKKLADVKQEVEKKLTGIREKISKHPETIEQNKLREKEREKYFERVREQKQNNDKNRGFER